MNKIDFNQNWCCYKTLDKEKVLAVTIPHDAMQLDPRTDVSAGGTNTGWYDAQDYTYIKTFFLQEQYKGKHIVFEFEGIYHDATVFINEHKAGFHSYGYTGFYIEADELLNYGEENTIRVTVINRDQPNSRWYTGTGIYRPVWMYILPKQYIKMDGIKITTLDYKSARIRIDVEVSHPGTVKVEILWNDQVVEQIQGEAAGREKIQFTKITEVKNAKLWSIDTPNLYTCRVTYGEETWEEQFGIREIGCTINDGFTINGQRIILMGACIHHDNGLLGARAFDFAEERKIRILKQNGYNAVRSAHNPCSKALLRACDKLGMLVIDEYADAWYIHKTRYDYAAKMEAQYHKDLQDIVDKDYNHPSVIMYSTGNEVSETAQKRGIELCKSMTECLHQLDSSRLVTCGVNIFFNFLSSIGFGVYSDRKAECKSKGKSKKAVGSEFFNNLAGIMGSEFMKFGATLYPCDLKTRDAFAQMDIAGYNYGINRYRHDLKKYPERFILGTETFCSDAYKFVEEAKNNKRLIGDFVWTGMDYLGELGIGAWEYKDYAPDFSHGVGWVLAGAGRIDITGRPLAEMSYTRVAYGIDKIGMAVVPVKYAKEKHSPSCWKMTNAIESWSFGGCEQMGTRVEVYSKADRVELYINGRLVGTKRPKNNCKVIFSVKYEPGELKALAYEKNGEMIGEKILRSAGPETEIRLEAERRVLQKETDLCYVRIRYTDRNGVLKPLIRAEVEIDAEGGEVLGIGSACPYYPKGYSGETTDTYYGEALAIIRPTRTGSLKVSARGQYGEAKTEIKVVD